jgi:hypothetical protein
MKIKNYQESKGGVNQKPKTPRPSPPKGMNNNKDIIITEIKFGAQYLISNIEFKE